MKRKINSTLSAHFVLDAVCIGFVGFLIALAYLFPSRVIQWRASVEGLAVAGILYAILAGIVRPRFTGFFAMAVHTGAVLGLSSHLFRAVSAYQHVFVPGWMDDLLLSLEYTVTGTESTLILEKLISPALTEWMMFSYVMYVPLLPAVALVCYFAKGEEASTDYLVNLSLANVLCYSGFILFPVAGPLCYSPEQYMVPLGGGFFAQCGEWMRTNLHYPGGCLPSPHCAAATVMIVMLYRYNRRLWRITLPVLTTIYIATVYGRYHYAWDSLSGILVGILVMKVSPLLIRFADLYMQQIKGSGLIRDKSLTYVGVRKEGGL
jgi:hypothetical protein